MDSRRAIESLLRKRVRTQERLNAPDLHSLTAGEYEEGAEFVEACNFAMDAIIERDGLARCPETGKGIALSRTAVVTSLALLAAAVTMAWAVLAFAFAFAVSAEYGGWEHEEDSDFCPGVAVGRDCLEAVWRGCPAFLVAF